MHARTEDKRDDMKNSFYQEPEYVSDKFQSTIKMFYILLGDFNIEAGSFSICQSEIRIYMKLIIIMD
jgi:hypothetical protein